MGSGLNQLVRAGELQVRVIKCLKSNPNYPAYLKKERDSGEFRKWNSSFLNSKAAGPEAKKLSDALCIGLESSFYHQAANLIEDVSEEFRKENMLMIATPPLAEGNTNIKNTGTIVGNWRGKDNVFSVKSFEGADPVMGIISSGKSIKYVIDAKPVFRPEIQEIADRHELDWGATFFRKALAENFLNQRWAASSSNNC